MDDIDGQLRLLREQVGNSRALLEWLTYRIDVNKAFYLVCEPGYPNYGDELIAGEWLKYLARVHPDIPVVVDCARPGPASAILRLKHPHLTIVDTVARLTLENDFVKNGVAGLPQIAEFVRKALDDESTAARYVAGIHLLQYGVRSVHILGGGYLNARWYANLARLELGAWGAERHIPVIMTGAGLMPLDDDVAAGYARRSVASFERCTLRDEQSYESVRGANCELAPDDCFINGLEGCYSDDDNLPEIMVCVQSDLVDDRNALYSHVADVLHEWNVDAELEIGVIECNPYVDYPILPYLQERGYRCRFFPTSYLLDRGFPARPGQRWLSTRYHPHVLAAARGCSGAYIAVDDEYYGIKHHAVLRMGSHWSESRIGAGAVSPGAGFTDDDLPWRYARQIRHTASVVYGYEG